MRRVEPRRAGEGGLVEETAVQVGMPIATAENPKRRPPGGRGNRLGAIRAEAPKAIDEVEIAASATMEEVRRATEKVASNKGAWVRMVEQLLAQWPSVLPKLEADLLAGTCRPDQIRRA